MTANAHVARSWASTRLEEIAVANWGNTFVTKASYISAGYPAYSASGQDGFVSWCEHEGPAVIISAIGAQCGKTWLADGEWTAIKNTIWFRARGDAADTRFLYYATSNPEFWRKRGQAQPFIALTDVRNAIVPMPRTLQEQTEIADALGDADAWVESLEQLIAKKRAIMQGAMQELLAGRQRLYGQSTSWKRSEIGSIPADWETSSLGQLFAISGGVAASRDQLSDLGIPYLHYGDIHTSASTFVNVDNGAPGIPRLNVHEASIPRKSMLADGDIVFVDASEDEEGVSKSVVVVNRERVPFVAGLHTVVAKPKGAFDVLYGRYCFQSSVVRSQFRYYAAGMKVFSVNKTNLRKIVVPVPRLGEQHAIGLALSDMESEIDALEAKLAKARYIKQGMMQNLLTGGVRLA